MGGIGQVSGQFVLRAQRATHPPSKSIRLPCGVESRSLSFTHLRGPSIYARPSMGSEVHKLDLLWAISSSRDCRPDMDGSG